MVKNNFVPYAGDNMFLQAANIPSAKWYQSIASQAIKLHHLEEYFEQYKTYQGIYFAAPDGHTYGMVQDKTPESFLKQAEEVLAAHSSHHLSKTKASEMLSQSEFGSRDDNVSVVRVFYRCKPLPAGASPINQSIGRDYLWIFPNEIDDIVRTANKMNQPKSVPRKLCMRLCQYHLLDNVRGLADFFQVSEVKKAQFVITWVGEKDGIRFYKIGGDFLANKFYPGDDNYKGDLGVDGKLEAELSIDVKSHKVKRFRGISDGLAWGANSNTWGQPQGKFPLIIAMIEEPDPNPYMVPIWRTLY